MIHFTQEKLALCISNSKIYLLIEELPKGFLNWSLFKWNEHRTLICFYLTELFHCRHCTLFSSLADRLVGVTALSTDRPRLAGDWGFPLVGVSALDLAGEAVLVRAGDRVFLSAEGGDFRTFLLRLRERLLDRLLDEDLDVDLLPCETQFNKGFI